jgi:hypothetical protein
MADQSEYTTEQRVVMSSWYHDKEINSFIREFVQAWVKILVGKPEGKRQPVRPRHRWRMGSEWILGKLAGECELDSTVSG